MYTHIMRARICMTDTNTLLLVYFLCIEIVTLKVNFNGIEFLSISNKAAFRVDFLSLQLPSRYCFFFF